MEPDAQKDAVELLTGNVTYADINFNSTIPSRLATAVGAAIMTLFFIQGVVGNLWLILAILCNRKIWNVINIFIVSLCVNDLLTLGLIVVLIIDSYIWRQWTAGIVMCKLNPEFTVAFTGTSLWHTALIAIHRYIVVVHNRFYKKMSTRAYVIFVLTTARLIPFACTLPGFTMESSGYVPKILRCILLPTQKGRIISITMVQIIVPCAIVVLCYAFIFGFVYRLARQVADSNVVLQREIKITKMFGVIFLMILIGFIPYAVVRNVDRDNQLSPDMYVVVTVFYGVATCSSPLVYGAMSTEIRKACKTALRDMLILVKLNKYVPCVDDVGMNRNNMAMSDLMETNTAMQTYNETNSKRSSPLIPSCNNSHRGSLEKRETRCTVTAALENNGVTAESKLLGNHVTTANAAANATAANSVAGGAGKPLPDSASNSGVHPSLSISLSSSTRNSKENLTAETVDV